MTKKVGWREYKLSTSKYILIVRNVINEIMIELISNYHYGMIVYVFTHLKKVKCIEFIKRICIDPKIKVYVKVFL